MGKTEEEILTLRQVLTAKERHAAGLKRRLGITQWREFSEDMTPGLENLQFAKDIAREKSAGLIAGISASSTFQNLSGSVSSAFGAAKNRMSGSASQQTFDEALKEHNGSVASNNEAKTPQ